MWPSDRVERRIKLHDLHILMTVVQAGSMNKAAALLNTTQSAVSRSIAELEHVVGVRLLDRSRQGVEPTTYGRAVLDGGAAVFDDLHQTLNSIEFLADPTVGEIRLGANAAMIAGLLPAVLARLRRQHPKISIYVTQIDEPAQQWRELRERKVDIVLGRIAPLIEDDVTANTLFRERTFVVTRPQSKWARRRKIELSELAGEIWNLPSPDVIVGRLVADAFRASGIKYPPTGAAMGTIHLFSILLADRPVLAVLPGSVLKFGTHLPPLKVLPVTLRIPPWPVGIMTLKNRLLSPVTQLFIDCVQEVAKPLAMGKLAARSNISERPGMTGN